MSAWPAVLVTRSAAMPVAPLANSSDRRQGRLPVNYSYGGGWHAELMRKRVFKDDNGLPACDCPLYMP
jgi:hypothetical protein